MPKVKRGVTRRRRHKKVLEMTKGHRGVRHRLFKRAMESMLHALMYSYAHRKERKGDFRRLWIARINAAARQEGLSYSQFMLGLRRAEITVNRKILADMAVRNPDDFSRMVGIARQQLENDPNASSQLRQLVHATE
jgi:large subunit ribosomal protein L20